MHAHAVLDHHHHRPTTTHRDRCENCWRAASRRCRGRRANDACCRCVSRCEVLRDINVTSERALRETNFKINKRKREKKNKNVTFAKSHWRRQRPTNCSSRRRRLRVAAAQTTCTRRTTRATQEACAQNCVERNKIGRNLNNYFCAANENEK